MADSSPSIEVAPDTVELSDDAIQALASLLVDWTERDDGEEPLRND